jgi:dynein heavy chain
MNIVNT